MRVLVFGASGPNGREILKQAATEHQVTAFVRTPEKISDILAEFPTIQVAKGDILDPSTIGELPGMASHRLRCRHGRAGGGAVCVGDEYRNDVSTHDDDGRNEEHHRRHEKTRLLHFQFQFNLRSGIKRLIVETSLGCGDTADQPPWIFRFFFMGFFLKHVFADKNNQEKEVMASGLDWVIARPGGLTKGALTKSYKAGFGPNDNVVGRISRADVAHFMISQLSSDGCLRKAVSLSN
jgi:hypothetical protein